MSWYICVVRHYSSNNLGILVQSSRTFQNHCWSINLMSGLASRPRPSTSRKTMNVTNAYWFRLWTSNLNINWLLLAFLPREVTCLKSGNWGEWFWMMVHVWCECDPRKNQKRRVIGSAGNAFLPCHDSSPPLSGPWFHQAVGSRRPQQRQDPVTTCAGADLLKMLSGRGFPSAEQQELGFWTVKCIFFIAMVGMNNEHEQA